MIFFFEIGILGVEVYVEDGGFDNKFVLENWLVERIKFKVMLIFIIRKIVMLEEFFFVNVFLSL